MDKLLLVSYIVDITGKWPVTVIGVPFRIAVDLNHRPSPSTDHIVHRYQ